jgi:ATP-dependent Clp protease adaptor protein ClpS
MPRVPYRSLEVSHEAEVVLWNDPKTKMDDVVGLLTTVFGLSETRATYLMLTTHHLGRAVVLCCDRSEAKIPVERAMSVAQSKGSPLRVSDEAAGSAASG